MDQRSPRSAAEPDDAVAWADVLLPARSRKTSWKTSASAALPRGNRPLLPCPPSLHAGPGCTPSLHPLPPACPLCLRLLLRRSLLALPVGQQTDLFRTDVDSPQPLP